MRLRGPAALYNHKGDDPVNVNTEFREKLTFGQRLADSVARNMGAWKFIVIQSIILLAWMTANIWFLTSETAFDPYPFILLNLVLSFQAAYSSPIIMMSQNRQAAKDRLTAELDFKVNQKAEEEIKVIMDHLVYQDELIMRIIDRLEATK